MGEPTPDLRVVGAAATLEPGVHVTVSWYRPGEPYRPTGTVVKPAQEDLDRLREVPQDGEERCLVHWSPGNWRRWERVSDLRVDE